ncbi:MAG: hypothetical protein ACRC3B_16160 [Bacteroidia bacterium]
MTNNYSLRFSFSLAMLTALLVFGAHLSAQTDSAAVKVATDTTAPKVNKLPPIPPKKQH